MGWPKGKLRSEKTRRKMSAATKLWHENNPHPKPMLGKHHSKETIAKMKESSSTIEGGSSHPRWKGGRIINSRGYVLIWKPDHPFCGARGYVREARLVVKKAIGRYMKKDEVPHHINEDKADNRNCNLLVCLDGYHKSLHHKIRRLKKLQSTN